MVTTIPDNIWQLQHPAAVLSPSHSRPGMSPSHGALADSRDPMLQVWRIAFTYRKDPTKTSKGFQQLSILRGFWRCSPTFILYPLSIQLVKDLWEAFRHCTSLVGRSTRVPRFWPNGDEDVADCCADLCPWPDALSDSENIQPRPSRSKCQVFVVLWLFCVKNKQHVVQWSTPQK